MYSEEMEVIERNNPNMSRKVEHTDDEEMVFGLCSSATTTKGLGVNEIIFTNSHSRIHRKPYL